MTDAYLNDRNITRSPELECDFDVTMPARSTISSDCSCGSVVFCSHIWSDYLTPFICIDMCIYKKNRKFPRDELRVGNSCGMEGTSIIIQVWSLIKYDYIKEKPEEKSFVYRSVCSIYLGVVTSHHPIGPSFTSIVATKQRLYYNNLGTRLDCSATGTPVSVLTWFRTNGTDDRPTTFVQSSELMWDISSRFVLLLSC